MDVNLEKEEARTFKSEFLGQHKDALIKATFDHRPTRDNLLKPLPSGYAIWMFCIACGTKRPLTLIQIGVLVKLYLRQELKKENGNFVGKYLEAKKCSFCDSQQIDFALKDIPKEKIVATFNHQPNPEKLKRPLPAQAIMFYFCTACGVYYGITQETALTFYHLLKSIGAKLPQPENFPSYYVSAECCVFCDSERDHNMKFLPLP